MIRYLIIDDEPIAHRIIEGYCAALPHLHKTGNAYNALEASVIVTQQKVDLLFLDINMPKITGFEWLRTLPNPPCIVVTTAYQEYALEGYELNILDYLLKPFSFSRFLKAVNKVLAFEKNEPSVTVKSNSNQPGYFFIKGDKKHHQIHTNDILYMEAFGNYCKIYLSAETILSHETISSLESLLPQENFLRIHKSFIVATDKIKLIQGNLIYIQEHKIPIGQTYRSRVKQLLRGNL